MSVLNAKNQNKIYDNGVLVSEDDWYKLTPYAGRSDFIALTAELLREADKSGFSDGARYITREWLSDLETKVNAIEKEKGLLALMDIISPSYKFIRSLNGGLEEFFRGVLKSPATKYILVDSSVSKIFVITNDPSTSNILYFASLYMGYLNKEDASFDFMVHGDNEIDEQEFKFKVTPEDWYAFGK